MDRNDNEDRRFYYTYGPFKPTNEQRDAERKEIGEMEEELREFREVRETGENSAMVPRPSSEMEHTRSTSVGGWSPAKKRSPWKRMMATFLAGAVVMAGLMYASDSMNWFTGDPVWSGGNNGSQVSNSGNGNGSDVRTAALGDVVRPADISDIVETTSPAIVKIETYVKPNQNRGNSRFFQDDFFRYFFGDEFAPPSGNPPTNEDGMIQAGMGSGFIFDKEGYILTNEHVVGGADKIMVQVMGYEEPFEAELLGHSFDLDLAVLKIKGQGDFPALPLGDSQNLEVGDWVVAIGNPYGFDHTVTVGVLSAKERPISIPDGQRVREYKHLLQTDASINPGNSGGPLINLNGEVIGINTAVSTQAQGIGFAIPTTTVTSVLDYLIKDQEIPKPPKPYIGVYMADIREEWVEELGLKNTDGVIVRSVVQGSPAERAGLQPYDVVLKINDETIKDSEDLKKTVESFKVGERITMEIVRDGQKLTTGLEIGDQNN